MNLVLFTHPAWLRLQSQTGLVRMMVEAFAARGHEVQVRQPEARLRALLSRGRVSKWAGYVDQYLLFPRQLRAQLAADPPDTLYVFCDQALGAWIPMVRDRPHVVHCLDLLALRSALGLIPENPTSWTGRVYQRWIRAGYRHARHFISISEKSRADLHTHGGVQPLSSEVVYLGLNHPYRRIDADEARLRLEACGVAAPADGLLLHVGGGQWYKNSVGVVALYAAYVRQREAAGRKVVPLMMVSPPPNTQVQRQIDAVPGPGRVQFLRGIENDGLEALYSLADALLFPSLAEGFGWPIAEAMACGCPVITTDEPPMNEVGGPHAHYMPRLSSHDDLHAWSDHAAQLLCELLDRSNDSRDAAAQASIEWSKRFDTDHAIDRYLSVYQAVLTKEHLSNHRCSNAD